MFESIGPEHLFKVEPEVIGCSWLPERELVGRGRAPGEIIHQILPKGGEMWFLAGGSLHLTNRPPSVTGTVTTMLSQTDYDALKKLSE